MSLCSTMKIALKAIYTNKLRSILTMLGIIIGVASVIISVSIGQGSSKSIENIISSIGTNLFIIVPKQVTINGVRKDLEKTLTVDDSNAIENECSFVKYSSPRIYVAGDVVYKNHNFYADCIGVSKDYDKIGNWSISEGEFFTEEDVENGNQVCVIGNKVFKELFNEEDAIDKFIRINNIPFRVVGVLESKDEPQDIFIFIPYTTIMSRLYKKRFIWAIHVSIVSDEYREEAKDEITTLLRQRHNLTKNVENDFNIGSQVEAIKTRTETKKRFTLFLAIVASISLLVGGIGIMNIMLVSVTERIREIGIRMSLGARGIDVLKQFLFESMTISVIGGIIGIIIGIMIAKSIPNFFSDVDIFISVESIIISFIFSAFVGIFFGFYPAWQASKLEPIEALRNESDCQISFIKALKSYTKSNKVISFWVIVKLVLQTIYKDKIKEFLAMLGIIIGIASVITMISVGQGVAKSIQDSIALLGKNLIEISPKSKIVKGVNKGLFHTLKIGDSNAIENECSFVTYSSPVICKSLQVVYANKNCSADIYGVSENYYEIKNWEVSDGEFFTEEDVKNGNKVCVIGNEVVKELFNEENSIGQFIRLNNIPFKVIGALKQKGEIVGTYEREDGYIFIPYTVARSRIEPINYVKLIHCSIADDEDIEESLEEIKLLLRQRHNLQENDLDDFEITTKTSIKEVQEKASNLFTLFLSSIAFISLLVGGIGIMNIMLVSVTARTKEIGIRMSVGARRSDILKQFLFESVRLSVSGGIIGIITGIVLSQYVPRFFPDLKSIISIEAIIISFLFSVGVGIFFGFYPAWQASKLDPIEALRYE